MNTIFKMKFPFSFKSYLALICFVILSSSIFSQPFEIGHTNIVFHDDIRNRNISTEIYYPVDVTGENVPLADGEFPVLVFGHGFLIGWDSYQNFWNEIVPKGYVICFPTTEMGITPDHEQFGEDLKFLATQMQIETLESTSLFFNSLAPETGLLGHSMGGGASFLAAENNLNIHTLINFAAAETNPSAITAANNITIPTLIFSGDDDCVAPPIDNQGIMYDNLNSDCKTHVKIINGGHCYFANSNATCDFGESFCNSSLNITRPEQQSVTNDFLNLWLDYSLKGDQNAFTVFNDSLQTSNRINYSQDCNPLGLTNFNASVEINVFPNPVIDEINLVIAIDHLDGILSIYDMLGQQLQQQLISSTNTQIDLSDYPNGSYLILYNKDQITHHKKLIKIDR